MKPKRSPASTARAQASFESCWTDKTYNCSRDSTTWKSKRAFRLGKVKRFISLRLMRHVTGAGLPGSWQSDLRTLPTETPRKNDRNSRKLMTEFQIVLAVA